MKVESRVGFEFDGEWRRCERVKRVELRNKRPCGMYV